MCGILLCDKALQPSSVVCICPTPGTPGIEQQQQRGKASIGETVEDGCGTRPASQREIETIVCMYVCSLVSTM
jgi:hypothetical protein